MRLLCKHCGRKLIKNNPKKYKYIDFAYLEIDEELDTIVRMLDEGMFCSPVCLQDYLSFEGEAE